MLNVRSTVALLFASIVVFASTHAPAVDRTQFHRLSMVDVKFGSEERQAWISAIGNDQTAKLGLMIAQYDIGMLLELTASNGKSALMVASKKGDLQLARTLVAAGASVHDETQTNGTAFMFAVLGNQIAVAKWLVVEGAKIDVIGSNGWSALTIAAAKGHDEILSWLIESGADAQHRDVYRYTPFLRAVENGQINAASILLALPETDVNAQDEYDNSSLHHAVSANHTELISLLLNHGANPDVVNRDGLSARALAKSLGRPILQP